MRGAMSDTEKLQEFIDETVAALEAQVGSLPDIGSDRKKSSIVEPIHDGIDFQIGKIHGCHKTDECSLGCPRWRNEQDEPDPFAH